MTLSMIGTPSSSSIKEYGYDKDTNTLAIRFHTGRLYYYHKVPEKVYNMMRAADSAGQYVNNHVKGVFKYSSIAEKKEK